MSLRLIKGLVIAMSVALALGFAVLMVGLAQRAIQLGDAEEAPPFRTVLDLPDGASIITLTGAGDSLAVLVEYADGSRLVHLVDPETGRRMGLIER